MNYRIKYVFTILTLAICVVVSGGMFVSAEMAPSAATSVNSNAPDITTIALDKTVGTDSSTCATTEMITVAAGTQVYYCYKVTNEGQFDLDTHTLIDDKLGTILSNWQYVLTGGASTFITRSAEITVTTVNSATWSSTHPLTLPAKDDAEATVTVPAPAIAVTKTVGLSGSSCATTSSIEVDAGTTVYYCYTLSNNGLADVSSLTLTDDQLGGILTNDSAVIAPSATMVVTQSAVINADTTNVATFSAIEAYSNAAAGPVMDSADVTITVTEYKVYLPILVR